MTILTMERISAIGTLQEDFTCAAVGEHYRKKQEN